MRMVVGQGMVMTTVAVVVGVMGALAATGLLSGLLYEVAPRDPRTFAVVAGLLTIVALAASWLPARRATRIDPIAALRDE
jgi:ABC-type antimicrobial peptide transport system permease subunit